MVVEQQQAPAGTYVEAILDTFAAHPDREAVVVGAQRITYAQARSSVLRMAEVMRERGVGTGDIVAVVTGNRAEGVLLPLAVHLLGGRLAFVPPEPALVEQRGFLTRAGVSAIIFDPAIRSRGRVGQAGRTTSGAHARQRRSGRGSPRADREAAGHDD